MSAAIGPIIGGVISLFGANKAAAAQKKAIRAQEKQQALADAQARRRLLRQSQQLAGATINTAASIGGLGSSGLQGGLYGLNNQVQSQFAYQNQSFQLAKDYNKFMQQAENANMWGRGLGNLIGNMNLGTIGFGAGNSAASYGYTPPTWKF